MSRKRSPLQFRLVWIFVTITIVATCLSYRSMRLNYLVWNMSNEDVTSNEGYELLYTGATKLIVVEFGLNARSILKSKLDDPERFAAAHVALSEITGAKTGSMCPLNGAGRCIWSRLNYSKSKDNAVQFKLADNPGLAAWWFETVGVNVGSPLVDEQTLELYWPKSDANTR